MKLFIIAPLSLVTIAMLTNTGCSKPQADLPPTHPAKVSKLGILNGRIKGKVGAGATDAPASAAPATTPGAPSTTGG